MVKISSIGPNIRNNYLIEETQHVPIQFALVNVSEQGEVKFLTPCIRCRDFLVDSIVVSSLKTLSKNNRTHRIYGYYPFIPEYDINTVHLWCNGLEKTLYTKIKQVLRYISFRFKIKGIQVQKALLYNRVVITLPREIWLNTLVFNWITFILRIGQLAEDNITLDPNLPLFKQITIPVGDYADSSIVKSWYDNDLIELIGEHYHTLVKVNSLDEKSNKELESLSKNFDYHTLHQIHTHLGLRALGFFLGVPNVIDAYQVASLVKPYVEVIKHFYVPPKPKS